MRSGVVLLLVSAVALSVLSGAAGSPSSQRLVPTAVVFVDRTHGVLGLASPHCTGCAASGAIAMTSDGGKAWHVVVRTHRRVVAAGYYKDGYEVSLEGHRSLWTDESGHWHRSSNPLSFSGYCPKGWKAGDSADLVDRNIDTPWSICSGMPGAGLQAKAVYRGKTRVAYTPATSGKPAGGIGRSATPSGSPAGTARTSGSSGNRAGRSTYPATAVTAGTPSHGSRGRRSTSASGRQRSAMRATSCSSATSAPG